MAADDAVMLRRACDAARRAAGRNAGGRIEIRAAVASSGAASLSKSD